MMMPTAQIIKDPFSVLVTMVTPEMESPAKVGQQEFIIQIKQSTPCDLRAEIKRSMGYIGISMLPN